MFIALALLIATPKSSNAQLTTVPGTIELLASQTFVIRNVVELNDALFFAPHFVDTTDWAGFTGSDITARVENAGGNTILQKALNNLGAGVTTFYFDPTAFATDFTFPEDATIILQTNPTSFTNSLDTGTVGLLDSTAIGTSQSDKWINTTTLSETQAYLEDRLPSLMELLEAFSGEDLTSGGKINIAGAELLIETFPLIVAIAPDAFTLSSQIESQPFDDGATNFGDSDIGLQTELDTATNDVSDSLTSLSNEFGFNDSIFSFFIIMLIAAPLILILRRNTDNAAFAFASISGLLVFWTSLGLMSVAFIMTITILAFALLGMWIWSRIPTN